MAQPVTVDIPRLTTVDGAYFYFMASLLALVAAFGVYFLAVYMGVAPPPEQLGGTVGPVLAGD